MVNQAGQVATVRDVHTSDFEHMVEACIPTATNPDKCAEALEGLRYFERVDRWYAIMTLSEHGATLPIYADRASAELQQLHHVQRA
jgi:hypothetical protein